MYNITEGTKAAPGNELGIFEDLGDVYSQEDLDFFFSAFARYVHQSQPPGQFRFADMPPVTSLTALTPLSRRLMAQRLRSR